VFEIGHLCAEIDPLSSPVFVYTYWSDEENSSDQMALV